MKALTSMGEQKVPTLNISKPATILARLRAIPVRKKPTVMANAQATSDDANRSESGRQIGICLWGVKSPCNSDSDLDSHR